VASHPPLRDGEDVRLELTAIGLHWDVPKVEAIASGFGLGLRGVAVQLNRCPPRPFPRFPSSRHSPIRTSVEHISQAGEPCVAAFSLAHDLSENRFPLFGIMRMPLLIMPGCLFDECLDCRLRQLQNGCAEAITEKIKAA
jgi:hypothetical protein